MNFPNFKNKHEHEAMFSPQDFIGYAKQNNLLPTKEIPKNIIFIYQSSLKDYIEKNERFNYIEGLFRGSFFSLKDMNIGVIFVPFGGAPGVVTMLEELVALGAEKFLTIGTAGGLQLGQKMGDIILCDSAIRDEGTSYHYLKPSKFSYPHKGLTQEFEKGIQKNKLVYSLGPSWTTDAPYRETVKEAKHFQSEGVLSVEMEASALFAVSKCRNVQIAGAFVLSDLLGELVWSPYFERKEVEKSLIKLYQLAKTILTT